MQIGGVVQERELKLRQALRTMGMLDSAYWSSWVLFEVCMHSCMQLASIHLPGAKTRLVALHASGPWT